MAGQPLAEVVKGAQVKAPFARMRAPQGLAHLDVIAELVVHLLVPLSVQPLAAFRNSRPTRTFTGTLGREGWSA